MSHYSVHTPLQAKEELVDKFTERKGAGGHDNPVYAAMIASVDNSLDRLRLTLTELGLENETILIFCSDNGGYRPATSMQPLRGSKGMLYEGGIRVPMIVLFPGLTSPGSICRTPVISLDIFPTLRETAGIKKTGKEVLDGISMLPLLGGRSFLDRDLFWHFPSYLEGYREQETWRTTPAGAIRSGEWKLIEFFEDGRLELYNLDRDISEKHNLVDTYPEKTLDLHNRLKRWRRITGAPVPSEPNPEYRPNR